MLHLLPPSPVPFPDQLRERLRHHFVQAEQLGTYALGTISWLPGEGVFEDRSFYENDAPYLLCSGEGRTLEIRPSPGSGFDYGRRLFTPAFTISDKKPGGPLSHALIFTHPPSEGELRAIPLFFGSHPYSVWLAELLGSEAVRVLEIAGR